MVVRFTVGPGDVAEDATAMAAKSSLGIVMIGSPGRPVSSGG